MHVPKLKYQQHRLEMHLIRQHVQIPSIIGPTMNKNLYVENSV